MTMKYNNLKKVLSIILCVIMVFSCLSLLFTGSVSAQAEDTRVTDPSTMDDWKKFFLGNNTENSGGIWTDKSVFSDASAFSSSVTMEDGDNNFLVALSAMSAQTRIKGYSYLPTDTVFVLDVSRSVGRNSIAGDNNHNVTDELIDSTNKAMEELLSLNNNNRVGVVLYSGSVNADAAADASSVEVILPIGRYEHSTSEFLVKGEASLGMGTEKFVADTIKVNTGVVSGVGATEAVKEKTVEGGSYVQSGLYAAMREFLNVEDTEVEDEGFQVGTKRLPVLLLMNDGTPTFATSAYMGHEDSIGSSDMGNGDTPENELASAIPFVTQLTAAYAKEKITEHYGTDALFYTIGYREGDVSVIAPSESKTTDAHWQTYEETAEGGVMQLAVKRTWINSGWYGSGHWDTEYKPIYKSEFNLSENYVDEFFCSDEDFSGAFSGAVDEIISKSLYYPTQVDSGNTELDGYIEFIDDIGRYMDVKKVHGILLGDYLFTGNNIAKNFVGTGGALGTLEKPSNLGDEMIRAVKARLGIKETADAQKLVDDAYKAGQLAYNAQTGEYSNYIGWYADKDGKYICHGTREDTVYPETAEFYNESYGYLGEVFDGHKDSDMMYVSVQVHTRLSTNTSAVIFRIPASLIPLINYEVTLTGNSVKEAGDITFNIDNYMDVDTNDDGVADRQIPVSPIRLLFEVGLSDEINEFNVSEVVGADYQHQNNGEYSFYVSRWDNDDLNHKNPSLAKNTVSFYEPSVENERYYYTKNEIVYIKNGEEYLPYTGPQSPASADEIFYREFAVYETVNDQEENNGRMHLHYAQIAPAVLKKSKPNTAADKAGTWYIPKGTVYRMFDSYHAGKGGFTDDAHTAVNSNNTGTVMYSHYFGVEQTPEGEGYYADVILGNNGKITLTQAQGLKLTADDDVTMLGRDDVFEFSVKAENPDAVSGEYRLVVIGEQGMESFETISFEQGEAVIKVKAFQTAYLVDLPEGERFKVTESTADKDYQVSHINGESKKEFVFEVQKNALSKADFIHSLIPAQDSGAVVIYNKIEHPFDYDYVVPENIEFTYEVKFKNKNAEDCTEEFTLKPDETKHITDILLGEDVCVVLKKAPAGFTSDMDEDTRVIKVLQAQYYIAEVTNTYTPESVSPQITFAGTKKLYGRAEGKWLQSDEFTIKLQNFSHSYWADMTLSDESAVATVTGDNRSYNFSKFMDAEVYSEVGVYSYRVLEVFEEATSQGITFDKGVRWFDVTVTDKDMDGSLEIDDIKSYGGTFVSKAEDGSWNITADFTNNYSVAGSDTVTVWVKNKVVASDTEAESADVSFAGYEYGLYQGERLVTIFPLTNESGETMLTLSYGNFDIGKHIHYVIKQMPHEDYDENIEYSEQEYHVIIEVVDDTVGSVKAQLTVKECSSEEIIASGDEAVVEFTNIYKADIDATEPQPSQPASTVPTETQPTQTNPTPPEDDDVTGSTDNPLNEAPDIPDTGFLGTMNIILWIFTGVILIAALICIIFVGKRK